MSAPGAVDLELVRAGSADAATARDAYRRIVEHLAVTADFPHWHEEDHPSRAEIQAWVDADDLYLARERGSGQVAGVVALDHRAPGGYAQAAWAVQAQRHEVLVVHALGVCPDFLGRGVGRFLVDASLDVARQKGCRAVRLDTYVENLPARRLYARCGFTDLGLHTLRYEGTDLDQFHLFERVL